MTLPCGSTTGGFTFAPGVQDRVIVRTNYANTPATAGKPASRHDDLMVIYVDTDVVKADYFDSESHVIRYVAEARSDEVVFLSEVRDSEPRYRLTYRRGSATTLNGTLDVAAWEAGCVCVVSVMDRAAGQMTDVWRRCSSSQ